MIHRKSARRRIVLACLGVSLSLPAAAQNPCDPASASPSPGAAAPPCLALPTAQERLKDYLHATLGPKALLASGASAGIGHARNDPSAWEQEMAGYGRRYGASFGKRIVDHSIRLAVESALGEDSRYFPSPGKGTWSRIRYAVRNTLVARTENGKETVAVGRLAGTFGGGLVSRTWHPEGHDTFVKGLRSGGISFSFEIATNVFREFWPDLRKRLPF